MLTLERQSPGEHITGVVGARIDFVTDDRATGKHVTLLLCVFNHSSFYLT